MAYTFGDVPLQASLSGAPDLVFRLVQKQLPAARVIEAAVSRRIRDRFWGEYSRLLNWIDASEMKLADQALSRTCEMMTPSQIEAAESLHRILFDVLRGRLELPDFPSGSPVDVSLIVEGLAPALTDQLLASGSTEAVRSIQIAAVHGDGRHPSNPYTRWLPLLNSGDTSVAMKEITLCERYMAPEAVAATKGAIENAALFFRRRHRGRVGVITSLVREKMGEKADTWLAEKRSRYSDETRLQDMTSDTQYPRAVEDLKRMGVREEPRRQRLRR